VVAAVLFEKEMNASLAAVVEEVALLEKELSKD